MKKETGGEGDVAAAVSGGADGAEHDEKKETGGEGEADDVQAAKPAVHEFAKTGDKVRERDDVQAAVQRFLISQTVDGFRNDSGLLCQINPAPPFS